MRLIALLKSSVDGMLSGGSLPWTEGDRSGSYAIAQVCDTDFDDTLIDDTDPAVPDPLPAIVLEENDSTPVTHPWNSTPFVGWWTTVELRVVARNRGDSEHIAGIVATNLFKKLHEISFEPGEPIAGLDSIARYPAFESILGTPAVFVTTWSFRIHHKFN